MPKKGQESSDSVVVGGKLICWGSLVVQPENQNPAIRVKELRFAATFEDRPMSVVIGYNTPVGSTGPIFSTREYDVKSGAIVGLFAEALPSVPQNGPLVEINYMAMGVPHQKPKHAT